MPKGDNLSIFLLSKIDIRQSVPALNKSIQKMQGQLKALRLKVSIDGSQFNQIRQQLEQLSKGTSVNLDTEKATSGMNRMAAATEKAVQSQVKLVKGTNGLKGALQTKRATLDRVAATTIQVKDGEQALDRVTKEYTTTSGRKIRVVRDLNRATGEAIKTNRTYTNDIRKRTQAEERAATAEADRLAKLGQIVTEQRQFTASTEEGRKGIEAWAHAQHEGEVQLSGFTDTTRKAGQQTHEFTATVQRADGMQQQMRYSVDETTGAIYRKGEVLRPTINRMLNFVEQMRIAIVRSVQWGLAMGVLYGSLRKIREGLGFLRDLDKDLTQVSVITNQTRDQTRELAKEYATLGLEMGKTVSEISRVNTELIRQGLAMDETESRLRVIVQLSSAANMEISESLQFITSAVNALGVEAETAADVALRASQITASSVPEVAEAFTKTASSAKATGVELTELGAIISGLVEITQESPSSLGNSMKTLLARFNQVNSETGELNEEINRVGAAFASAGVQFTDAEGQVRPFFDLIQDLSLVWDDLDKNTQLYISTMAAGKQFSCQPMW